jgi:hypothetical protein
MIKLLVLVVVVKLDAGSTDGYCRVVLRGLTFCRTIEPGVGCSPRLPTRQLEYALIRQSKQGVLPDYLKYLRGGVKARLRGPSRGRAVLGLNKG